MPFLKSNEKAVEFKNEGNQLFKEEKYFEALIKYNKALCYAEASETLYMIYSNRSATYLKLKQYKNCLTSIGYAKQFTKTASELKALGVREDYCNSRMTPVCNPWDFIKLCYEPKKNGGFMIDCIQYSATVDGFITTKMLKPGDFIAIERSMVNIISFQECYSRCCWCGSCNQYNLIPCLKTSCLMFCSEECRNEAYEVVPSDKLEQLIDLTNGKMDPIKSSFILKLILQDNKHPCKKSSRTVLEYDANKSKDLAKRYLFFKKCIHLHNEPNDRSLRQQVTPKISTFTHNGQHKGFGFSIFGRSLNHSCNPNVNVVTCDNKFVFYVTRPIQPDEELFLCFETEFSEMGTRDRRELLFKTYGMNCKCTACMNIHFDDFRPHLAKTGYVQIHEVSESLEHAIYLLRGIWNAHKNLRMTHPSHGNSLLMRSADEYMEEIAMFITYGHLCGKYDPDKQKHEQTR